MAKQSYDLLLADKGGLTRDLAIDPAGLRTVLELRSKYENPRDILKNGPSEQGRYSSFGGVPSGLVAYLPDD